MGFFVPLNGDPEVALAEQCLSVQHYSAVSKLLLATVPRYSNFSASGHNLLIALGHQ